MPFIDHLQEAMTYFKWCVFLNLKQPSLDYFLPAYYEPVNAANLRWSEESGCKTALGSKEGRYAPDSKFVWAVAGQTTAFAAVAAIWHVHWRKGYAGSLVYGFYQVSISAPMYSDHFLMPAIMGSDVISPIIHSLLQPVSPCGEGSLAMSSP